VSVGRGRPATAGQHARERLVVIAGELPGVRIEDTAGHTAFVLRGRRLAWLLVDHHGDGLLSLCVRAPAGEQEALVKADPARYFVPAYVGRKGWVGVRLDPEASPDWAEVEALLRQAWRITAGKRAVDAFDLLHQTCPPEPSGRRTRLPGQRSGTTPTA
jgi:hypothetical protein